MKRVILAILVSSAMAASPSVATAWDVVSGLARCAPDARLVRSNDGRILVLSHQGHVLSESMCFTELSPGGDVLAGWSVDLTGYGAIAVGPAGGLVIVAEVPEAPASTNPDVCVLWTNAEMEVVRSVRLDIPSEDERGLDVVATSDGGALVAVRSQPAGPPPDGYLVRFEADTSVRWARWFPGRVPEHVEPDGAGGYFVVGGSRIMRVDDAGAMLEVYSLGGTIHDAVATPDGGLVVATRTGNGFRGDVAGVVRFDAALNVLWQNGLDCIDDTSPAIGCGVGSDGRVVVATHTQNFVTSGPSMGVVFAVDSSGSLLWQRVLPDAAYLSDVRVDSSGVLVAGSLLTDDLQFRTWVAALDPDGMPEPGCVAVSTPTFREIAPGRTPSPATLTSQLVTLPVGRVPPPLLRYFPRWSSVGGDEFEMQDRCPSSSVLRLNEPQQRNFCDDAEDESRLETRSGTTYVIETSALGPAADTIVELLGGDCATVVAADDDGGGARASRLSWTATGSETLTVRVRQADGSHGPGRDYELRLSQGTPRIDRWMRVVADRSGPMMDVAAVPDGVVFVRGGTIVKLTADGSPAWALEGEPASLVEPSADGGIVVVAEDKVVHLDGAGNVAWSRSLGGMWPSAIAATRDGGYVAADSDDVVRLASDGSATWATQLGRLGPFGSVTEGADGTITLAPSASVTYPSMVARLDAAGNFLWCVRIDAPPGHVGSVVGVGALVADDGDVVASFNETPTDVHDSRCFLVRLDSTGAASWSREVVGMGGVLLSRELGRSGRPVIAGYGVCGGVGESDAFVFEVMPDATLVDQHFYHVPWGDESVRACVVRPDGGLALVGRVDVGASIAMSAGWVASIAPSHDLGVDCPLCGDASLSTTDWPAVITPVSPSGVFHVPTTTQPTSVTLARVAPPFLPDECAGRGLPPDEVSPPGAVTPLLVTNHTSLTWEPAADNGAETFNVYRGLLSELRASTSGSCWQDGLRIASTTDPEDPPTSSCWFYLVTAENPEGEGPMGRWSTGRARVPSTACP